MFRAGRQRSLFDLRRRSFLPARVLLGFALGTFLVGSCAGPELHAETTPVAAPVVASGSALSADASERAVDSRLDARHDTERVRVMVDAFRAQAKTPLVAGNRVRLLVDGPQTLGAIRRAKDAFR